MTDDLSEKLSGILSDPEAMQEIAALASQLGVGQSPKAPEPEKPAKEAQGLMDLLGGSHSDTPSEAAALTRLLPLLSSVRQEDETTRLLDAMRPFLSEERQHKLDKAKRLIKVLRLMPLIRELPLFE